MLARPGAVVLAGGGVVARRRTDECHLQSAQFDVLGRSLTGSSSRVLTFASCLSKPS